MQRGGWTKHHRQRWDKGYHLDQLLWVIMDYFIDFANWEDGEVFFPNIGVIFLEWMYSRNPHFSRSVGFVWLIYNLGK